MSAKTTLLNAKNPVALLDKVFQVKEVQPLLERQRDIQAELAERDLEIIQRLDTAREYSGLRADIRAGLLHQSL